MNGGKNIILNITEGTTKGNINLWIQGPVFVCACVELCPQYARTITHKDLTLGSLIQQVNALNKDRRVHCHLENNSVCYVIKIAFLGFACLFSKTINFISLKYIL